MQVPTLQDSTSFEKKKRKKKIKNNHKSENTNKSEQLGIPTVEHIIGHILMNFVICRGNSYL